MKSIVPVMILVLVIVAAILGYVWGTSAPSIELKPSEGAVSVTTPLTLSFKASRGSLKQLAVTVLQGDRAVPVLLKSYATGTRESRESLNLARGGLNEGPFTLKIAIGGSLSGFSGRSTTRTYTMTLDNTPPSISVLTTAHNIIRGGSGLVVYTVNEETQRTGVVIADRFFPGYRQGGEMYACLFPFPYDLEPDRYVPRVIAVDKAGNERTAGINYHLIMKSFSTDRLNLSDSFLEKIAAEFKNKFPQALTPLEIFQKANGDLRRQNVASLYDFGRRTSPTPLWQGVFLRMPNAAPLGGFAQTRFYLYKGQQVDRQTHLGFDLASLVHAPVPAANSGTVVFAGDLGIYGQCVIIDHGLGLQTLYGHMSRMTVKAGDKVEKGEIIGNTGATGMAAGDHLHFGVTVSGQEVNPVEWWDASWIMNNITGKLEQTRGLEPKAK
ncbi:M23 family metallopeptidase [Geobacter sp. SVR]|uniref:M23 family metallopeptidase n=1 Tax=Geobacter sp. SVR TaxID=2495594 RepID=UPI00143F03C3|nr:M23 family metallopeptidase [Geobacter sp. SVR]BCS54022.1 peptidase M24 [Geobacter sp. SVR]GCF86197.1 peptidase M24 [Geobacter sp. SVR]